MPRTGKKLWTRAFVTVVLIHFLIFMNHMSLISPFSFFIEDLGGTATLAGLVAASLSVASILTRPFNGFLIDRVGRRTVLILGLVGMVLMSAGYLVTRIIGLIFVIRMIHGVSIAAASTATGTMVSDVTPEERLGEGMGMFGLAVALSSAVAPAFGLFLMNSFGFSALFATAAVMVAVALVLSLTLHSDKDRMPQDRVRPTLKLSKLFEKDAVPASVIQLLYLIPWDAQETFVALFASKFGLPSGGWFFAIMAVFMLITRFSTSKVVDRHGEAGLVCTGNVALFLSMILLGVSQTVPAYILSAVLAGFAGGAVPPALQAMSMHIVRPERRGAASSTYYCSYDAGLGIGAALAGALANAAGYPAMWILMGLGAVVSLLLYIFWGSRHPSSFRPRA